MPAPKPLARVAVLLVVAIPLVACGPGYQTKREELHDTARQFNDDVRWKRLTAAAAAVEEPRREQWLGEMKRAARAFTIVDYEFRPVTIGSDEAVIEVDLSFHRVGGVRIEQMRRRQLWRHTGGSWQLLADREVPREDEPPPSSMPEFGVDPTADAEPSSP